MRALSIAFRGIEAIPIEIQVKLLNGLPGFSIVGLPDKVVAESKERVKSAINSLGLAMPLKKIVVNLSPADITKEGSHYDLPIALCILAEMDIINRSNIEGVIIMGELSLDGDIIGVRGVLPAAALTARLKYKMICPYDNGGEAMFIENVRLLTPRNLLELINYFKNRCELACAPKTTISDHMNGCRKLSDIKGHALPKRACIIAIAGRHNFLMIGPPGSGKSMLASGMASIMPTMSHQELLEVNMIRSISGDDISKGFSTKRPYRAPHHSCSTAAMVGGGRHAKPGEVSLAHNGILFLDELPEFSRSALESLRQPMEDRRVTIARAESHVTYPANFQMVAAMNPCKCGYAGTSNALCSNFTQCASSYMGKISGPILDRIDIAVHVEPIDLLDCEDDSDDLCDKITAEKVMRARDMQLSRFCRHGITSNAEADWNLIQKYALPEDKSCLDMVRKMSQKYHFSARTISKIFQVARTIADLEGSIYVAAGHIAESMSICARSISFAIQEIKI